MGPSQWRITGCRTCARPGVDGGVVVGVAGDGGEGAAGHQDDAAADGFDGFALMEVGGGDVAERVARGGGEVVGAGAAEEERTSSIGCGGAAADEFERERPVEAHSALRGVHGLGHAKAERPEILAVGKSGVPIDHWMRERIGGAQRVDDNVGGGKGDTGREWGARGGLERGTMRDIGVDRAAGPNKCDGRGHASNSGTSSQRRSRQDWRPSSASCTPRAPSRKSCGKGASSATWRRNISHWTLKALSTT